MFQGLVNESVAPVAVLPAPAPRDSVLLAVEGGTVATPPQGREKAPTYHSNRPLLPPPAGDSISASTTQEEGTVPRHSLLVGCCPSLCHTPPIHLCGNKRTGPA